MTALSFTCVVLISIRLYLKYTINKCVSKFTMVGKVVIVTGANSGIGFHTAKELAMRGARVILACRNKEKALIARDKIIKDTGNHNVIFRELDLSSLDSVRKFAKNIIETEKYLHVLINNAGLWANSNRYTKDNIVEIIQVNYFGPFLLTLLILPLLKKSQPSRIINLSSLIHFIGEIDLNAINVVDSYDPILSYSNSKLADLIFSVELSKRLKGSGVVVNAVHPGIIFTNLLTGNSFIKKSVYKLCCLVFGRTVEQGAQTVIHLAVSKECENVSGKYFVDCSSRYMSSKAQNAKVAELLWDYSEKLVDFHNVMYK